MDKVDFRTVRLKIKTENHYSDGHESVITEYVEVDLSIRPQCWGDEVTDQLFQYTGDGHGIGNDLDSTHTITILEAEDPQLVGKVYEY